MFPIRYFFDENWEHRRKIRQIFPVLCGCLIPVSFGMMLGWPSLAYPYLIQWDISPIPITLDQTSLIAGFLMEGNSIGTLFSMSKLLSSKAGVFFCCCLQFFGWCVMFGANDIFGLLIARATVGFGNGYGTGQLKRYIKETCDTHTAETLIKYMPLGVNVGVVFIYCVGSYVPFRAMAVFSALIPLMAVISFGVIPKKTRPLLEIRRNVLSNLEALDVCKLEKSIEDQCINETQAEQLNVLECLKDVKTRNGLILIMMLVFVQQYTGGPANIVYSQIIFTATGNLHPKICGIIYATSFFYSTLISLTFAKEVPRKINLLWSCGMCVVTIGLMGLYFHVKHDLLEMSPYFVWTPLFVMMLFNLFHTFGIATVPLLVISEKISKSARNVADKFWVIHFSMSAVISTKIFQVLFGIFDMAVAYAFFAAVALGGLLAVLFFMEEYNPKDDRRKSRPADYQITKIEITKL